MAARLLRRMVTPHDPGLVVAVDAVVLVVAVDLDVELTDLDVVTVDVVVVPHEKRTLVTVKAVPVLDLQEIDVGPDGGLQGEK
jgi:hypothetical protein